MKVCEYCVFRKTIQTGTPPICPLSKYIYIAEEIFRRFFWKNRRLRPGRGQFWPPEPKVHLGRRRPPFFIPDSCSTPQKTPYTKFHHGFLAHPENFSVFKNWPKFWGPKIGKMNKKFITFL